MENESLLTIEEIAKVLNIDVQALRMKLYKDPFIPRYKVGGNLRFNKNEVLQYFKFPKPRTVVINEGQ